MLQYIKFLNCKVASEEQAEQGSSRTSSSSQTDLVLLSGSQLGQKQKTTTARAEAEPVAEAKLNQYLGCSSHSPRHCLCHQ